MGPMMQQLLADRFQLKIHRASRAVPVYHLVAAKGGSKVTPFQEGSCTPVEFGNAVPGTTPPNGCHTLAGRENRNRDQHRVNRAGSKHRQLCEFLLLVMDRPVIHKTGIAVSMISIGYSA